MTRATSGDLSVAVPSTTPLHQLGWPNASGGNRETNFHLTCVLIELHTVTVWRVSLAKATNGHVVVSVSWGRRKRIANFSFLLPRSHFEGLHRFIDLPVEFITLWTRWDDFCYWILDTFYYTYIYTYIVFLIVHSICKWSQFSVSRFRHFTARDKYFNAAPIFWMF